MSFGEVSHDFVNLLLVQDTLDYSEVLAAAFAVEMQVVRGKCKAKLGLSDKKCVRSVCRRVGPFYLMGPFRIPMLCWYSVGIALS